MNYVSVLICLFFFPLVSKAEVFSLPTEDVNSNETDFSERAADWPTTSKHLNQFNLNAPKLDDYFNEIPGIQSRDYGSPTISIRGSAQLGRVLQLVNGIPLNGPDGFGASRLLLPKEVSSKLLFLKGPSSIFYGTQAMAGAVNFVVEKFPRSQFGFSLSDYSMDYLPLLGGNLSAHSMMLAAPIYKNQKNFWQISLFQEENKGDFDYKLDRLNLTGTRSNNLRKTQRLTAFGFQTYGNWSFEETIILASANNQLPGSIPFPLLSLENTDAHLFALKTKGKLSNNISINSQTSFLSTSSVYDKNAASESSLDNHRLNSLNNLKWKAYPWLTSNTFVDYSHDQFSSSYAGGNFLQDHLEVGQVLSFYPNNSWHIQPGWRYLPGQDKHLASLLISQHWSELRTWQSYSQGFRRPSLTDLHSDTSFFQSNPLLQPEEVEQIEIGISNNKPPNADGWHFRSDLFYINYTNLFSIIPISSTKSTKINQGTVQNWGGDLELEKRSGGFSLGLNYSYLKNTNGQTIRLSPEHQLRATTSIHLGPLVFQLAYNYWHHFFEQEFGNPSFVEVPSWQSVDFNLSTFGFSSFQTSFSVKNIFNRRTERTLGYPEPGRQFHIKFSRFF